MSIRTRVAHVILAVVLGIGIAAPPAVAVVAPSLDAPAPRMTAPPGPDSRPVPSGAVPDLPALPPNIEDFEDATGTFGRTAIDPQLRTQAVFRWKTVFFENCDAEGQQMEFLPEWSYDYQNYLSGPASVRYAWSGSFAPGGSAGFHVDLKDALAAEMTFWGDWHMESGDQMDVIGADLDTMQQIPLGGVSGDSGGFVQRHVPSALSNLLCGRQAGFSFFANPGISWWGGGTRHVRLDDVKVDALVPSPATYTRIAGADRFGTSVAVSKRGWPTGSSIVILATGANFPDALCGAPLARIYGAPMLLSAKDKLLPVVAEELKRLNPTDVVILGGTSAVTPGVEKAVSELPGRPKMWRIGGADRYQTSMLIATTVAQLRGGAVDSLVAVTGSNYPDALSVAPVAAARMWPILLTSKDRWPYSASQMSGLHASSSFVVGGPAVVSEAVRNQLPACTRVAGADRWGTCAAVLNRWAPDGAAYVGVANGLNFPDALVAGPLLGRHGGMLALVGKDSVPVSVGGWLGENRASINNVDYIGGTGVISGTCCSKIQQLVQ